MTETLVAWLETSGTAPAMAERLSVHPQTVRYRMRNLERALDGQLSDPDTRFAIEAVLRATRLRDRAGGHAAAGLADPPEQAGGSVPDAPTWRNWRALLAAVRAAEDEVIHSVSEALVLVRGRDPASSPFDLPAGLPHGDAQTRMGEHQHVVRHVADRRDPSGFSSYLAARYFATSPLFAFGWVTSR